MEYYNPPTLFDLRIYFYFDDFNVASIYKVYRFCYTHVSGENWSGRICDNLAVDKDAEIL